MTRRTTDGGIPRLPGGAAADDEADLPLPTVGNWVSPEGARAWLHDANKFERQLRRNIAEVERIAAKYGGAGTLPPVCEPGAHVYERWPDGVGLICRVCWSPPTRGANAEGQRALNVLIDELVDGAEIHEEDCPEDDTCRCYRVERVQRACEALEAALSGGNAAADSGLACDCGHPLDQHWGGDCLECSCINGRPTDPALEFHRDDDGRLVMGPPDSGLAPERAAILEAARHFLGKCDCHQKHAGPYWEVVCAAAIERALSPFVETGDPPEYEFRLRTPASAGTGAEKTIPVCPVCEWAKSDCTCARCPDCDGRGQVKAFLGYHDNFDTVDCPTCGGPGVKKARRRATISRMSCTGAPGCVCADCYPLGWDDDTPEAPTPSEAMAGGEGAMVAASPPLAGEVASPPADAAPDPCWECGGHVEVRTGPGRTTVYRGDSYEIPPDFPTRVCTACGAMWMSSEEVDALGRWLEERRGERITGATDAPAERKEGDEQGIHGAHAERAGEEPGGDTGCGIRRAARQDPQDQPGRVAGDVPVSHEAGGGVVLRKEGDGGPDGESSLTGKYPAGGLGSDPQATALAPSGPFVSGCSSWLAASDWAAVIGGDR